MGDALDTGFNLNPPLYLALTGSLPLSLARVTLGQPNDQTTSHTPASEVVSTRAAFQSSAELTTRLATALSISTPTLRQPWKFHGNGGSGFKTWLTDQHALDFNPSWLSFSMFDSANLDVVDGPLGPGQSEPQTWRSTITVGMGAEWELHPNLALQAGYRFYDNPMPGERASGALLNATQHVMAAGLSYRLGAHSLALIYGLDLMDAPGGVPISSARYGDNLAPTAHLVSFVYAFAF